MIAKPFSSYDITLGLTALKNRIPPTHEKYSIIIEELSRYEAGEQGEQYILQLLSENELPKNTYVLHNVQFKSKVDVQIDVLIISPSWCLLLEVKNIKGALYFQDNPLQLIRIDNGIEQNLGSPEVQLTNYIYGLKALLESKKINLPIYGAIVSPFNNAIIKKTPKYFPIKTGKEIIPYIWNIQPKIEGIVNPTTLVKLITTKHTKEDNRFPLCNYFNISKESLIQGVACPSCGTYSMVKTLRTWYCPNCKKSSMHAHEQALKDYSMLINKTITTQEALSFLRLRNRHEAKRILKANSLERIGATKSSRYILK